MSCRRRYRVGNRSKEKGKKEAVRMGLRKRHESDNERVIGQVDEKGGSFGG